MVIAGGYVISRGSSDGMGCKNTGPDSKWHFPVYVFNIFFFPVAAWKASSNNRGTVWAAWNMKAVPAWVHPDLWRAKPVINTWPPRLHFSLLFEIVSNGKAQPCGDGQKSPTPASAHSRRIPPVTGKGAPPVPIPVPGGRPRKAKGSLLWWLRGKAAAGCGDLSPAPATLGRDQEGAGALLVIWKNDPLVSGAGHPGPPCM